MRVPSRMLRVASVAMMEGILTPRIKPGVDQADGQAAQQDEAHAEQDLGGRGLDADQERGEDHAKADRGPNGKVDVADEEGMGLGEGGHDQGQRQDQDLGDVGGVDESRESGWW